MMRAGLFAAASLLLACRAPLGGSTSPWRMPHDQLQDAFQRPTLRPRTTTPVHTGQSDVMSNSVENPSTGSGGGSSGSEETPDRNRSYKTFYRVFYGTPPPPASSPDPQPDRRGHVHRTSTEHDQQRSTAGPHSQGDLEDIRNANDHFMAVRTNFRCGVPAPRVFRVKDFYRDPSREYLPRCAVLHRCGDDVGCCDNDAFHCAPRTVQEVTLTFYVLSVSADSDPSGLSSSLDKLLFENHTECECRPLYDLPRSGTGVEFKDHRPATAGAATAAPRAATAAPSPTVVTITTTAATSASEENTWRLSKCRECPVPFHRRQYPDGRCSCDCFDKDKPCLKVKRGKDPLEEVERRCVEVSHCHIPECDYGDYDYDTGKCPKRPENYRKPPDGGRGHVSPAHRWNYLERD